MVTRVTRIYNELTNRTDEEAITPIFEQGRPGDVHCHIGSGYLIKDSFGFEPKKLDIGLVETIRWYMEEAERHG